MWFEVTINDNISFETIKDSSNFLKKQTELFEIQTLWVRVDLGVKQLKEWLDTCYIFKVYLSILLKIPFFLGMVLGRWDAVSVFYALPTTLILDTNVLLIQFLLGTSLLRFWVVGVLEFYVNYSFVSRW